MWGLLWWVWPTHCPAEPDAADVWSTHWAGSAKRPPFRAEAQALMVT